MALVVLGTSGMAKATGAKLALDTGRGILELAEAFAVQPGLPFGEQAIATALGPVEGPQLWAALKDLKESGRLLRGREIWDELRAIAARDAWTPQGTIHALRLGREGMFYISSRTLPLLYRNATTPALLLNYMERSPALAEWIRANDGSERTVHVWSYVERTVGVPLTIDYFEGIVTALYKAGGSFVHDKARWYQDRRQGCVLATGNARQIWAFLEAAQKVPHVRYASLDIEGPGKPWADVAGSEAVSLDAIVAWGPDAPLPLREWLVREKAFFIEWLRTEEIDGDVEVGPAPLVGNVLPLRASPGLIDRLSRFPGFETVRPSSPDTPMPRFAEASTRKHRWIGVTLRYLNDR